MISDQRNPFPSPNRVSLDTEDIRYWTNRFSVSEDRLRAAIAEVGVDIEALAQALKN